MNDTMALNELADLFSILETRPTPYSIRVTEWATRCGQSCFHRGCLTITDLTTSRTPQSPPSCSCIKRRAQGLLFAQSLSSPGMGRPRFRTLSHRANPRRTPAREYRCISHPLFKMRIRYGIRANISWMIDAHDGPSCVVACSIAPKLAVSPRG